MQHNLLDPSDDAATQTVIETGIAGDIQTSILYNTTQVNVDLVYKDIEYTCSTSQISGVAMSPDMDTTPQLFGRFNVAHHIPKRHMTPSLGVGIMQPATYETEGGTFVQYDAYNKEQVPEGQLPTAILSTVAGVN